MEAARIPTAVALAVLTALICVVAIAGSEPLHRDQPAREAPAPAKHQESEPEPAEVPCCAPSIVRYDTWPSSGSRFPALWVGGAVVLLASLGAAVAVGRGRRTRGTAPAAGAEPELVETIVLEGSDDSPEREAEVARRAVDAAVAPLRAADNPRAAVVEAYALMEAVLSGRDLGRRAPEAPREYLERVLRRKGMPEDALTTLTDLFEEARYSSHPISPVAPDRALRELERARVLITSPVSEKQPAVRASDADREAPISGAFVMPEEGLEPPTRGL